MGRWVALGAETELRKAKAYEIEGRRIAVFRTAEGFSALDDVCSHEYSLLSEGEVWDGQVYCPKHGSAFDLGTGAALGLPATDPVRRWNLKVEGGTLWVEMP